LTARRGGEKERGRRSEKEGCPGMNEEIYCQGVQRPHCGRLKGRG